MKQLTHKLSTLELVSLGALILFSVLIWSLGSSISIAGHYPLAGPEKRFGIIMVLFLGWLILSLVYSTPIPNQNITPATTPETLKKLQSLQGRFQGAIDFLKKTIIHKQGMNVNLANLPWYLLIGPQNSGKTTLLANSHIHFTLSKQFKSETITAIPPSEACDWWATRDLVLVDIPSSYIYSQEKPQKIPARGSLSNMLWYNLLTLIFTRSKTDSLRGVVIALNLPEIMQQSTAQQKVLVTNIRQRIKELSDKFGKQLPYYFIITKCDLLPGFLDFFNDSSTDELAQHWGLTLPNLHIGEKISDLLTHRFNAIIKRLNKQLLWRLHKERNPAARTLIKDFPLQMERIKEQLIQFTKALALPQLNLNGVFFTSAIQTSNNESTQAITINANQHHALQILQTTETPSKPYFIRQLILQALFHSGEPNLTHTIAAKPWQRLSAYAASALAILGATLLLGYDFKQSLQQTYAIQNNLTQYQLHLQENAEPGERLINALPLLNALQAASENSQGKISRLANHLAFYSKKSEQNARDVYLKTLQTLVLPNVKNIFEAYLSTATEKNAAQTYTILKAYLMLADKKNLQPNFILSAIKTLAVASLNTQAEEQLINHIQIAVSSTSNTQELNEALITTVRHQLASLPPKELAYLILKNMNNNNADSPIKLGTDTKNASVFISKELSNQIPNIFTASGIKTILAGEISIAANEATRGNWVTGIITTNQDAKIVAEQLQAQYLSNYIDIWESQLANIKLYTPKNLTELNSMLESLTSDQSPLLQMLQTIHENTAFENITHASPKLQMLNTLLTHANDNQDNYLYQMFLKLRQLNTYVGRITSSSDLGNAALEATQQHLQKGARDPITNINALAEQVPEPLKLWLTTMSTQSWRLISQAADQKAVKPIFTT